jgi:hypothetical protein
VNPTPRRLEGGPDGSDRIRRDIPPRPLVIHDGRQPQASRLGELRLGYIEERSSGAALGGRHSNIFCRPMVGRSVST